MQVEGKSAIVTGGGTGVGRATALQLARLGCSVLVNYSRSDQDAEKTAAEAAALGVKAIACRADVADDAAVRAMTDTARKEFGRLDVLVNNAGTTTFVNHADLEKVTEEIVNVASVAGVAATGSSIPYCASKAAVNNMTIALARVLAPEVRVNAIAPGAISGRWLKEGLGEAYDQVMSGIASQVPLKATCTPEDVADAIVGLITGSDLVTGQVLVCDGGMLIR